MLHPERLAAGGIDAGQHRDELVGIDLALQAEILGCVAEPAALSLSFAGVVVLGSFGDLVEVVALLARSHLPDREHQRGPLAVAASMPLLSSAGTGCIGGTPGEPSARGKCSGELRRQSTEWKCRMGAYRPAALARRGAHGRGRGSPGGVAPMSSNTSENQRVAGDIDLEIQGETATT